MDSNKDNGKDDDQINKTFSKSGAYNISFDGLQDERPGTQINMNRRDKFKKLYDNF